MTNSIITAPITTTTDRMTEGTVTAMSRVLLVAMEDDTPEQLHFSGGSTKISAVNFPFTKITVSFVLLEFARVDRTIT